MKEIKTMGLAHCNEGRRDRRTRRDHTAICEFEWRRCQTADDARKAEESYQAEQTALWG
jgi:hypothetical protein